MESLRARGCGLGWMEGEKKEVQGAWEGEGWEERESRKRAIQKALAIESFLGWGYVE